MKRFVFLLVCAIIIQFQAIPQSCLPEGITFSNQIDIDNFQTNYPECTEIEGNVFIEGENITNLDGLDVITGIGGKLQIGWCDLLINLSGLENLIFIGSDLWFYSNDALSSLTGLNNLGIVGGDVSINWNNSLADVNALNNLDTIGGDIIIYHNNVLTGLEGLENINPASINNLYIYANPSLSNCDVQSLCDFLANPNGSVNIFNNAVGCNSPTQIANGCGITLSCFPYGNYYLKSQIEVDSFFVNFPNCFNLHGSVNISGNNITSLSGLNGLTSIKGSLSIYRNDSLINFTGLNTLISIGEQFLVGNYEGNGNPSLSNFTGLESLTKVGGSFAIRYNNVLVDFTGLDSLIAVGHLEIGTNDTLISLSGMENLDSINNGLIIAATDLLIDINGMYSLDYVGNYIEIKNNKSLNSLSGLDNIDPNSLNFLKIYNNDSLSMCEVQSICEYISDSSNSAEIYSNAPGCNSQLEVEVACLVGVQPQSLIDSRISIYPNPTSNYITIVSENLQISEVNIYNQIGQKVLSELRPTEKIDVSSLIFGIYVLELVTNETRITEKLIIK